MKATTRRPVGTTGLEVTALGVGSAPLGGLYADVPAAQALEMLDTAWDLGIRYFDTAPMYGLTRAEHLVGQTLRERDGFTLSTKVGRRMTTERAGRTLPPEPPKNPLDPGWWNGLPFREVFDYSYDGVMRSYDDSQQRLGMKRIDLLYVHDIGRVTHADLHDHHWGALTKGGGFRALQELKAAGDIGGFGLGVNEWEAIRDALEETDLDCCMLAGRYSLLDRDAADIFLPLAERRGVALVVAGVYNSGILAAPKGGRRKFNYADADSAIVAKVEALRAVCDGYDVPLAAAAIRFPMRYPAVTAVVIGAKTATQLRQNVEWFDTDLPDAIWADLDEALGE
ncbi:aldo/keto reductase [Falsirhodobacter sp. 20TX0035]|uniref:aldo/keto reductase n=1 Tax=Falsirhodobacter sp. 20TX0035 TaxID=3022019 RepID=UPI00232C6DFF|nr:aldo/keto reductase [Falsirhodobacter sp. 20TX0035]MDB6454078.1 aldo/keto reductase [Falsirhodobacter sp. 20TX0035]